jgi:hypothetical protein
MLLKNINNYNVDLLLNNNKSIIIDAFSEVEVNEMELLSLPYGIIKFEKNNLLIEPNMCYGKSLSEEPIDTSNLLLEG